MNPHTFELAGKRYHLGVSPKQLQGFHLMADFHQAIRIRPGKRSATTMVHDETGTQIHLSLINKGTKTCHLPDASIYGIRVSFEKCGGSFFKIFPSPHTPEGIDGSDGLGQATRLLGKPADEQKVRYEEETRQETRTEVVTEVTEEEWDDCIDFYEEEVEYEVPYEYTEIVKHDAFSRWETDHCFVRIFYDDGITAMEFVDRQSLQQFAPKPPSKFRQGFLKFRGVCCFTTLLSTVGLLGLIFAEQLPEFLQSLSGIAVLLGWISALFACPWHLLKTVGRIIGWSFALGVAALAILCIVTTPIGILIGGGILLFAPSIVTIPYYFKTLRNKIY